MSNYSKTTNFTAKDALTTGDPNKTIKGTEFDTEFDAIATSSATKANKLGSATNDNLAATDSSGDLKDSGIALADVSSALTSVGNVTQLYVGTVASDGTAGSLFPSGWTAERISAGLYYLTPEFALESPYTQYGMVCSVSGNQRVEVLVSTAEFRVSISAYNSTVQEDGAFQFIAFR